MRSTMLAGNRSKSSKKRNMSPMNQTAGLWNKGLDNSGIQRKHTNFSSPNMTQMGQQKFRITPEHQM